MWIVEYIHSILTTSHLKVSDESNNLDEDSGKHSFNINNNTSQNLRQKQQSR